MCNPYNAQTTPEEWQFALHGDGTEES